MKINLICFLSSLTAILMLGCSERTVDFADLRILKNPLEREARVLREISGERSKKIAEMDPAEIIVLVNGYPLTKASFDEAMVLYAKKIGEQKNMNNLMADKYIEQFRQGYVKRFVAQRLLVDEAFRQGVVTTNEVCQHVQDALLKAAKKSHKPMSKVGDELKEGKLALYYELALSYVMDKFVAKKIPPKAVVDDEFVKAVQDEVAAENKKATDLNEQIRERLRSWRTQIIAKKIDFADVAKKYSQDAQNESPDAPGGYWGEFSESEMDDAKVAAAVFSLQKNEISDVLEDENGLHLVKVLDITPAQKDESDKVIKEEVRKLSHIYIEKAPILIREGKIELTSDLKYQMQMQAVNEYVGGLLTNGVHKVTYPHGTKLGE